MLLRYQARFARCRGCGFIQSENLEWIGEAYTSVINQDDVGLLSRSLVVSKLVHALVLVAFNADSSFCDFGGGYGTLTRLLRDRGLDWHHYDPYCQNLFARGHEADLDRQYELVTAVEVLEHMTEPLADFARLAALGDAVFATTLLQPSPAPRPGEWWYYALDGGQHVSLHTRDSLRALAASQRMHLISDGVQYHVMSRRKLPRAVTLVLRHHRSWRFIDRLLGHRKTVDSLTEVDAGALFSCARSNRIR